MSFRLIAYVRVSSEDERPENQEYAISKWAAERGTRL
jgi:DNA invertase Pin-like site-specific DNA recombinase